MAQAKGNTNRVQAPAALVEDTRIMLYKAPGPTPETHLAEFRNMSYVIVDDEDAAAGLIAADGWYRTPAEADAAREGKPAAKPPAAPPVAPSAAPGAEVAKVLEGLKGKGNAKARTEYAAGLGVDVSNLSEADALTAIGAALAPK